MTMSTSESDSDTDFSDDDGGMGEIDIHYDFVDDDDFCEFEDVGRFTEVRDSILGKHIPNQSNIPVEDIPQDYSIQLAMNTKAEPSNNLDPYKPVVDDSLRMYLTAPPLFRRAAGTNQACIAIDPTLDESHSNNLSTSELYVGNIPYQAKWYELKEWFIGRGHGVSRVTIKSNRNAKYAFVRFDSIATARTVLFLSETDAASFVFSGNILAIKRKQRSPQQLVTTPSPIPLNLQNSLASGDLKIANVYYGTVITGAAMKNLQRTKSIIANDDKFGIIAHHLMEYDSQMSSRLHIDSDKKKIAIISSMNSFDSSTSYKRETVKFEWNFEDFKDRQIIPVIINKGSIYILMKVQRPPIILEIEDVGTAYADTLTMTRLPGNVLIGHANAWLFRLSATDPRSDYVKLFQILYDHNLSPQQFTGENILHLMRSEQDIRRNFDSVQLVSNDDWIKQNQKQVDDFFNRRWPKYPFETKFEIMKLISKHMMTVNDLIVDEGAEEILNLCTTNTLVALTDRIFNFARRWFVTACDYDEDWDVETKEEQTTESHKYQMFPIIDDVPIVTDISNKHSQLRSSATGAIINGDNPRIPSLTETMNQFSLRSPSRYPGTFSRLLLYAFKQLITDNRLRRLESSGAYATRLELHTPSAHSSLIRKIYITPSTVFYEGPYREEKCTVTREYEKYQDRFLRVTFRDEDYRILHDYNDNMSKMYERIKDILKCGMNICDRNYQFLAFSSSQLREHSCWMFSAPNRETTVTTIHRWMGDFRNVHPVAKYAARLGQLFSTSTKGLKLQADQIKEVRDVERSEYIHRHQRTHCFTDGIGIISPRLAKQLAEKTKSLDGESYPCAFQIRCGGYKGMVCVDIFNRIQEDKIDVYFRKSMKKFPTDNYSIDVCRTSQNPTVAFLNRQIILLLSSLGIPDQNFIDLQTHMLTQLSALTGNHLEAIQALKELNEFGGNGFHPFLIAYMKRLGQFKDPFVWRLLQVIRAFLIKELRTKSKIRVQDSWCLLGVTDESGTLKYGQVFIQIDNSHQQKENPIQEIFRGPVIVTRNPCFHPGDMRKLQAVNIPLFHSLKNVIVFPQQGPRPHPKEMSGGDLDGDTFWITRHPQLIFPRDNEDPFDYQGQEDEAKEAHSSPSTPHTIEEVCNFFGEYIAADNLGLIANSHLVFADQLPDGAWSEKCLTLARMHSVAVDFAKNGVSAPQLTRELRPREYPPYMEKGDKPVCESRTVLGTLYKQVQFGDLDICINEADEIKTTSSFPYKLFFVDESSKYLQEARIIKTDYDRDVRRIMKQYGIRHEVEFVSGYILKFTSKQYMRETKLFDLRNEISHAYRVIQDKYLHQFWQQFYQSTDKSNDKEPVDWSKISKELTWKNQLELLKHYDRESHLNEVQKKASAWFRVVYEPWMTYMKKKQRQSAQTHPREEPQQERYRDFFSFAWLTYPILFKILEEQQDTINKLNEKLKKKKKQKKRKKTTSHRSNKTTNGNH